MAVSPGGAYQATDKHGCTCLFGQNRRSPLHVDRFGHGGPRAASRRNSPKLTSPIRRFAPSPQIPPCLRSTGLPAGRTYVVVVRPAHLCCEAALLDALFRTGRSSDSSLGPPRHRLWV